jgi:hypothetical protein
MAESLKAECGLTPEADWDIDIDLRKTPFGRRVVVRLTHRPTGRTVEDTVVGGLYRSDRYRWVAYLVRRLAQRMGITPREKITAPQVIGKRKRRR